MVKTRDNHCHCHIPVRIRAWFDILNYYVVIVSSRY